MINLRILKTLPYKTPQNTNHFTFPLIPPTLFQNIPEILKFQHRK